MKAIFRVLPVLSLAAVLSACASDKHTMTHAADGKVAVCRACYDEIAKVRSTEPRSGVVTTRTVKTHMCPDCKSELSIYTEGSTLKARCAKCVPDGADCDLCVPRQEQN